MERSRKMIQWKSVLGSSVFKIIAIVVIAVIPINIFILILSNAVVYEAENQISMETENALKLYTNQLDAAMKRMTIKLRVISREDIDFARLSIKEITDKSEYYRQMQAVVNLKNNFSDMLEDNEMIMGLYGGFPDKEICLMQSWNKSSVQKELRTYFEEQMITGINFDRWCVVDMEEFHGVTYLMQYKDAYLGAWIDLDYLAEEWNLFENEEIITAFCNTEGKIGIANTEQWQNIDLTNQHQRYDGIKHTLILSESKYADLYLVQILSKNEISNGLPGMIRIFQILSILSFIVLPVILIAMKKWMIDPMKRLSEAMEKIEHGDMEFRIEEHHIGSEFDVINRNFNYMMDEVVGLKINVYEEQLKSQSIKMRFLAQQIQPHFILNTLSLLDSYEQEEYPLIRKMILCLSRYFRYIVNAKDDFVCLEQEMEHIRNYFEIQRVRYPKVFFSMVEYEEEIKNCLIPPLLIQNFAENAIKHSLKLENKIDIFVIAQRVNDKVKIRMVDTGNGIEDELLEKIEIFRKTGIYQNGLGIGIQNAIERINILYQGEARLDIFKVVPHGTQVEITIPIRKEEENVECDCD